MDEERAPLRGAALRTQFHRPQSIVRAFAGFACSPLLQFSLLINDLETASRDQLNPRTRNRPIASGALNPGIAVGAVLVILPVAFVLSWLLNPWFAAVGAIYMVKDFAYSFGLKHVVIIDVFLIAAGFTLRAVAGALAIGVAISPWLYVVTSLGALFLGLNKRKHELLLLCWRGRAPQSAQNTHALVDEMLARSPQAR